MYKLENNISKVLLRLTAVIVSVLTLFFTNIAFAATEFIRVTDTYVGFSTYYTLDSSLDLNKTKLVVMDPYNTLKTIIPDKHSSSIPAKYLSHIGEYKLVLGYKIQNSYKVVSSVRFQVKSVGSMGSSTVMLQQDSEYFEFDDIPSTVAPFEDFTLTIKVLDVDGEVDKNYTGTIEFESDDANSTLPDSYTFVAADAGQKTFTNGFALTEVGTKTITVVDADEENEFAEVKIKVEVTGGSVQATKDLEITSPVEGTLTTNVIEFVGKVDPGLEVQVFSDGLYLTKGNADEEGNFSFRSSPLVDGKYVFLLETTNAKSDPITVTVATQGAQILDVQIEPKTVPAGGRGEIRIAFNEKMSEVAVIINGVRTNLEALDETKMTFYGQIIAPDTPNEYSINVVATNDAGSRSEINDVSKLNVGTATHGSADISFNVPSKIQLVEAVSGDKRITLNWSAATAESGIEHYRIYYGTAMNDLRFIVDTNDNSTSWFIPDLENGTTYYFSIYGVDSDGNEADLGSDVVMAVPGVSGNTTLHGETPDQVIVDGTVETGPEIIYIVLFSILLGHGLLSLKRES